MGKRGPRRQLSDDAICVAALDIISVDGLGALSMGSLARQLGASASGLYRYFDSKEALLVALQERAIRRYSDSLQAELSRTVPSRAELPLKAAALATVVVAFGRFLRHAGESPAEHRMIDAFLSSPTPTLSDTAALAVAEALHSVEALCAAALDAAVAAGALTPGDSRRRTLLLWAALHGLDHFRKRDRIQPEGLRVGQLERDLFAAMLAGFGAGKDPLQQALAHVLA
ncbi:MAG: AcrR family transcriptional regulator [Myxococcota bacterium]|jgi:AcrR family transcriptional regulator